MSVIVPDHQQPFPPPYPVRQFSVDEYRRLGEAGVLTEDDRVELLEGWIVPMMMRNPSHDVTVKLVERALEARLPAGWHVRNQSAITMHDSEPEPDLAVVRGAIRDYVDHHPGPADVALVVEVAESSLERDRQKLRVYARAGIAACWIVNLVGFCIECYHEPNDDDAVPRYGGLKTYSASDSVPLVIDGQQVAAIPGAELLP